MEGDIQGTIVEMEDLPVDALGNPQFDLPPDAREPEPLPQALEQHLVDLSSQYDEMARAVADAGTPLLVPALKDPDAPRRMDSNAVAATIGSD